MKCSKKACELHNISDATKEWLAYSKRDMDSANYLLQMKPIPLEIICFHCQQSAEKALKAFMVEHNIEVIKTHDLGILIEKCSQVSEEFKTLNTVASRLTDYAAQSRYPFAVEVEESDMKVALADTKTVWNFVQKKLGLSEN